jgi:predicted dehydrogenase
MRCTWGILGAGFVTTRATLPALQRSCNGRVGALASRDRARAQTLATQWQIARVYDDYQALLADPQIDAVYIALPNHLHAHWTQQAALAGKHVLCEKPLARTAAEARQMLEVCQQAHVQLMEATMYRFHPRMRRLQELLTAGAVGSPRLLHSTFSFPLRASENYRQSRAYGGGALLDIGCYCANALCWLQGASPVAIQSFTTNRQAGDIDLESSALLRFATGSLGHLQCSFLAAEYQAIEIVGSQGALLAPLAFTAWREDRTLLRLQQGNQVHEEHFAPADPYQLMVEHFVQALAGEISLACTPREAQEVLTVLDAIRAGAQTPADQ